MNQRLADEGSDFRLFTGTEVDILNDGLDFPDDLLAELDVVVASIHQGFTQSEAETTKRLVRAAENKYVHMLGHLTGRLLLERDGYALNHSAVIDACAATGTWIELNASPYRFDMDWRQWKQAKSKGADLCRQRTLPARVSDLRPNDWGVWQMHGNVYERLGEAYDGEAYKRRAVKLLIGLGVLSTNVKNWTLSGRHWLSNAWALTYDLVSHEQGTLYRRQGLRLGVRHSF